MKKIKVPRSAQDKIDKRNEAKNKILTYITAIVDDPATFNDLLDAADEVFAGNIKEGKDAFNRACDSANVPKDNRKYLWNLLTMRSVVTAKTSLMDQPFCW